MQRIFLFLSTGRCGTQWLASNLDRVYGDLAVVTHEPIGPTYRPNRFFRAYNRSEDMLLIDTVRDHLDAVDRISRTKLYIETGWPSMSAIPLFRDRFGDRLGLVHLVRDPVTTALSYVTLGIFDGRDDEWARAFLDPSCEGVLQFEYARRWDHLTPYEKCLFVWTEVNLYAQEVRGRYPGVPMPFVRAEDLFADPASLDDLASFLGLPYRPDFAGSAQDAVDEHRFEAPVLAQWRKIFDHPRTVALARSFGYALDAVDDESIRERYVGPEMVKRD